MYQLLLEKHAEKDLKDLPRDLVNIIIKRILSLKENPWPTGVRKIVGSKNDWRIRVRDYRIIYEIDDKSKVIKVFRVKHRKEVYR
jgi:mRNA interferase RelE/StbE